MLRVLPFLIQIALLVFCLVDCIQTDESEVRHLRKGWWILLIIFFPLVGSIAWLVAGRPQRQRRRDVPWPSTQTAGFPEYERPRRGSGQVPPDDDPDALRQMGQEDAEQERLLRKWEEDLRRREQALRDEDDTGQDGPVPQS